MDLKLNNRPYIGVGVLVWKHDTLLLGKRITSQSGKPWQFPGGHLENGESVTDCAAREVLEETGLRITSLVHAGFTNETCRITDRDYMTVFVSADFISGEAEVMEPDKCECWDWFRYDQLPSPLFLPITNFLKQYPDLKYVRSDAGTQAIVRK